MLLFVVRMWSGGTHVLCPLDRGVPNPPSSAGPPSGGQLPASGGSARGRPARGAQASVPVFARQDTWSETTRGAVVDGLPPGREQSTANCFLPSGRRPERLRRPYIWVKAPSDPSLRRCVPIKPDRPHTRNRCRKCRETHWKESPLIP